MWVNLAFQELREQSYLFIKKKMSNLHVIDLVLEAEEAAMYQTDRTLPAKCIEFQSRV